MQNYVKHYGNMELATLILKLLRKNGYIVHIDVKKMEEDHPEFMSPDTVIYVGLEYHPKEVGWDYNNIKGNHQTLDWFFEQMKPKKDYIDVELNDDYRVRVHKDKLIAASVGSLPISIIDQLAEAKKQLLA